MPVAQSSLTPPRCSVLILAGTDTTSSALGRILHLLAQHQDVQDKLREELAAVDGGKGQLDYDDLHALPYLEAVCRETLRLYVHSPASVAPFAHHSFAQIRSRDFRPARVRLLAFSPLHALTPHTSIFSISARKDMIVPLDKPIKGVNGEDIRELFVPNDTELVLSIAGVNCDRSIWGPDALEWKPERWLAPLPESVTDARIPGVYSNMCGSVPPPRQMRFADCLGLFRLTFLGGGRSCMYVFPLSS